MAGRSGEGSDAAEEADAEAEKDGKENPRTSSAAQGELGEKGGRRS
jgi:hypothetical protein